MATNLYEILGIEKTATTEQIRKAYRKKALQTHPDRLPQGVSAAEKANAEERFRRVNNAYEVLTDEENRRIYDHYGTWPPPTAQPEPTSAGPSFQRSTGPGGFFNDPFFNDPFFNDFGLSDPFTNRHRHFHYTDPFELFNSIFGDLHRRPFGQGSLFDDDFFNDPFPFGGPRDPLGSSGPFGSGGLFGSSMGPSPFQQIGFGNGNANSNVRSVSCSSMGYDNGSGDRRWVSQSRMTRTINGVTESVWKRADSNGNEHVTLTYPDGREKYTINGIEQPSAQENRYIQAPTQQAPPPKQQDRYLPPPPVQHASIPPTAPPSYHTQPPTRTREYEYAYPREDRAYRTSSGSSSHHSISPQPAPQPVPTQQPVYPEYDSTRGYASSRHGAPVVPPPEPGAAPYPYQGADGSGHYHRHHGRYKDREGAADHEHARKKSWWGWWSKLRSHFRIHPNEWLHRLKKGPMRVAS